MTPPRRARLLAVLLFCAPLLAGTATIAWAAARAWPMVAWPDECIYLVGARNVLERGTLATNFYLSYSILRRGHPHRDVHMPGYVLVLVPAVAALGPTYEAGFALNAIAFLGSILLVRAIARRILGDPLQAAVATTLFAFLPPFAGYLGVVYPEHVVALAFLAAVAVTLHAETGRMAALAGVLFALGAVFRESLLAGFPIALAALPRPLLLRRWLPAAAATLLLVVAPLSRERAVHPNALYPSVSEEARASDAPVGTVLAAVGRNVATNARLTAAADPATRAEDAVLLFLLALAVAAAASAAFRLPPPARRLAWATLASLAVLTAAVLTLYVVRERGGVWGGVRAYMPWAPLLLVLATPLLFAWRRRAVALVLAAAAGFAFTRLDEWQVRFFNRYKATDHEDQLRNERYLSAQLDRFRPTRILSRSFLYGHTHYPVEVIWSLPR
ncbi:MAG TPA: hypothetical protein VFM29_07060, partial [Vicinamibacteria bacterium]|nr:hypothetical protein [Vicinamibacteria bacterium]